MKDILNKITEGKNLCEHCVDSLTQENFRRLFTDAD